MIPRKTNKNRIVIVLILVLLVSASLAFAKNDLQITLKIVDEDGMPVDNARVEMTYIIRLNWKSETQLQVGTADAKGNFIASAVADDTTWFSVTKDGYYPSSGDYKFKEIKNNRWEPWNPEVRVVLIKKIQPVAMYARDTKSSKLVIPAIDKPIGFDLTMFDWVTPYGQGIKSDFIVELEGQYLTEMNYDMKLTLTFSNKYDGIQTVKENLSGRSKLKLARIAPYKGYQAKLVKYRKWSHQKTLEDNFENNNNYYFRIRSEVKDNKLIRAMYGKILGDIQFYPINSNSAKIIFKYYLNPDYTQNIEYDPQQNLFLNLRDRRSLEWVGLE